MIYRYIVYGVLTTLILMLSGLSNAEALDDAENLGINLQEGEILSPLPDERFAGGGQMIFEVNDSDDSFTDEDVCWSSSIDGDLGCGVSITVDGLSTGDHEILADVDGVTENVSIRVFDDLWEVYQAEPSQAEIDRILDDFNFVWLDDDEETWDGVDFVYYDDDPAALSKLPFIAKLDILRKQRFSEKPVFIGEYETIYDWAKNTIDTIEFRLDCGNASGGGGKVSFPRRISHWGPVNGGSDCGEPWDNFYLSSYHGALFLFAHELRHNEPDDPGHITFQRRFSSEQMGDSTLEDGSGYAWAAKYSMWVYKYSLLDPESIRHGYVNENVLENARATAVSQLETIYGDEEPTHSSPLVQAFLNEVRPPQLMSPADRSENIPTVQDFTWEEIPSAARYTIQIFPVESSGAVVWERPTDPFYTTEEEELANNEEYYWRVIYHDEYGRSLWSNIWSFETGVATNLNREHNLPNQFSLTQNYPNPFNPTTKIQYSLPEQANISITVYNTLGQSVATLLNEIKSPGSYEVSFDASNLSSGIYIYRLQTDSFTETRKMLLVK